MCNTGMDKWGRFGATLEKVGIVGLNLIKKKVRLVGN